MKTIFVTVKIDIADAPDIREAFENLDYEFKLPIEYGIVYNTEIEDVRFGREDL